MRVKREYFSQFQYCTIGRHTSLRSIARAHRSRHDACEFKHNATKMEEKYSNSTSVAAAHSRYQFAINLTLHIKISYRIPVDWRWRGCVGVVNQNQTFYYCMRCFEWWEIAKYATQSRTCSHALHILFTSAINIKTELTALTQPANSKASSYMIFF